MSLPSYGGGLGVNRVKGKHLGARRLTAIVSALENDATQEAVSRFLACAGLLVVALLLL